MRSATPSKTSGWVTGRCAQSLGRSSKCMTTSIAATGDSRRPPSTGSGRRRVPAVDDGPPSVDEQLAAGDERRRVGGEVDDGTDELVRARPAPEGALAGVRLGPLRHRADLRRQRRVDDARGDGVDAHALQTELDGGGPQQLDQTGLGRGVDALPGLDRDGADRAEPDDAAAAALGHPPPEGADEVEGGAEVQPDDAVELLWGVVEHALAHVRGRGEDEHVDG